MELARIELFNASESFVVPMSSLSMSRPVSAELPAKVLLMTVRVPDALKIAPPRPPPFVPPGEAP